MDSSQAVGGGIGGRKESEDSASRRDDKCFGSRLVGIACVVATDPTERAQFSKANRMTGCGSEVIL
jgi:hypothetical protein